MCFYLNGRTGEKDPPSLRGCMGSCPDWRLPKELGRKKLKVLMSLYRAFPYKYRIRFLSSSTAQTRQGIKQHFMMWELIKREGLSRGLGPRGSLKKAGKPSKTVPDLGEEVKPGVGGNKACSSVPDANKRCLVLSLVVW